MTNPTLQLATAETPNNRDPGALLSIQLCLEWDDILAHRDAWNSLLDQNLSASIFMTPEWLSAWWLAFGANKQLCALLFRDERNQIVAVAILFLENKFALKSGVTNLRMVGSGSGDSDALDFIVRPGEEARVAAAFLEWLEKERLCDICSLETLPQDSVVGRHLLRLLNERGWRAFIEPSPNFAIDLPATWDEYVNSLAPPFRPLLTRYPKRLESRYRVRALRCERMQDLEPYLTTLFDLHQKRWAQQGQPGAFSLAERRAFYFGMAASFLRRGWLQFWLLTLNEEVVAAQFCFCYRDTVSLLQEGFDPNYAREKVGYALRAAVLKEMIRSGARRYDFLGGNDSYKLGFGARQGNYFDLHFAVESWSGKIALTRRLYPKRIRRWLREFLPKSFVNFLRNERSRRSAGSKTLPGEGPGPHVSNR